MHTHQRITDLAPGSSGWWLDRGRRSWEFYAAPLVDGYNGISITRLLALFYAVLIWHVAEHPSEHTLTTNMLTLAIVTIAAAFGKSTFTFFLQRNRSAQSSESSDVTETRHETVEITQRLVDERNVVDGSAPQSMPAVGESEPS